VDTPEERNQVYGDRAEELNCIDPGGGIRGRRVGRSRLHAKRDNGRAKLGPPSYARKHLDAWCLAGKGELRIAYDRHDRARGILTSGRGQSYHGVSRGDRVQRAHRRLDVANATVVAGQRILFAHTKGSRDVAFGVRGGRVRWLLLAERPLSVSLIARLSRHLH
jgi:hypothetical protein